MSACPSETEILPYLSETIHSTVIADIYNVFWIRSREVFTMNDHRRGPSLNNMNGHTIRST